MNNFIHAVLNQWHAWEKYNPMHGSFFVLEFNVFCVNALDVSLEWVSAFSIKSVTISFVPEFHVFCVDWLDLELQWASPSECCQQAWTQLPNRLQSVLNQWLSWEKITTPCVADFLFQNSTCSVWIELMWSLQWASPAECCPQAWTQLPNRLHSVLNQWHAW